MDSDERDESNTHTFTGIGWQARLLVKKLRNQRSQRRAEAKTPARKSQEDSPKRATDARAVDADMREALIC